MIIKPFNSFQRVIVTMLLVVHCLRGPSGAVNFSWVSQEFCFYAAYTLFLIHAFCDAYVHLKFSVRNINKRRDLDNEQDSNANNP